MTAPDLQVGLVVMWLTLGLVTTALVAPVGLAREIEGRTLPVLLATTLPRAQILWDKARGALHRGLIGWLFLALHLLACVFGGALTPQTLLTLGLLILWPQVFLVGTGLYLAARFRRASAAVAANLVLALVLWVGLPLALGPLVRSDALSGPAGMRASRLQAAMLRLNPLEQARAIAGVGATGREKTWWEAESSGPELKLLGVMFWSALVYGGSGVALAFAAGRRLCRDLFRSA